MNCELIFNIEYKGLRVAIHFYNTSKVIFKIQENRLKHGSREWIDITGIPCSIIEDEIMKTSIFTKIKDKACSFYNTLN